MLALTCRRCVLLAAILVSASPAPAHAQTGFTVQITQPRNAQAYGYIADWLRSGSWLNQFASEMNAGFVIPERVWIVGAECGEENAYWQPDRRAVVLCYELLNGIFNEFRYDGLSNEQFGVAVASASLFVLLHEVGHGLIDVLNLPTTGREEDVVDQFATLILANADDGSSTYWAAQYWRQRQDFGDMGIFKFDSTPFSDEHAFDEQRFYNILCWSYGSSPENRGFLLEILPQNRAVRCPQEYQRMATAWESLLEEHVRDTPQTTIRRRQSPQSGGGVRGSSSLAGVWSYTETLGRPGSRLYCENTGTYSFDQAGRGLEGEYQQVGWCQINGERIQNPGNGTLTEGRTQGDRLWFEIENCSYQGQLVNRGRIEGGVSCMLDLGAGEERITGTWAATRS